MTKIVEISGDAAELDTLNSIIDSDQRGVDIVDDSYRLELTDTKAEALHTFINECTDMSAEFVEADSDSEEDEDDSDEDDTDEDEED